VTKISKKRKHKKEKPDAAKKLKSGKNEQKTEGQSSDKGGSNPEQETSAAANIWKEAVVVPELKSREEEFDEYLDDLFL
jgi:protein FRA10AC1